MVKSKNRYAGFWIRFLAFILDSLIVGAVLGIVGMGTKYGNNFNGAVGIVAWWLYFAFMESSNYQGTVGKLALGLKVTDVNRKKISFPRATGRHFAKFLSAIILLIGFIMIAFTNKKQGLHDKLADTLVVMK